MRLLTWIFAFIGVLGVFDWMFAGAFVAAEFDNRAAQAMSAPWVLYTGLAFMLLSVLFAWISGRYGCPDQHDDESAPNA